MILFRTMLIIAVMVMLGSSCAPKESNKNTIPAVDTGLFGKLKKSERAAKLHQCLSRCDNGYCTTNGREVLCTDTQAVTCKTDCQNMYGS